MKPLFSVIIPAYNIQNYILPCLESVANQSIADYEVIIIDDGSTDNTKKICEEYVNGKPNFHLYHKINGGLSSARNTGVEKAKGIYLMFLDGDDYLLPETLENYKNGIITNKYPDVVLEEGQYYDKEGKLELSKRCSAEKFGCKSGKQALEILVTRKPMWAAFGKCFKKEFWIRNDFQFKIGITSEDLELIYKVIYNAEKVCMIYGCTYCYRCERNGSIMQSISVKYILDLFEIIRSWETFFIDNGISDGIQKGMKREFGNMFRTFVLFRLGDVPKEKLQEIQEDLRYHLKYLFNCNNAFLAVFGYLFGVNSLIKLCKTYVWFRRKVWK